MNVEHDPVERALELLRREHGPVLPDPALEARLMERFARRAPARARWRRPWLFVAFTALASAGFAAAGGVEWLRAWWYRVEVDGRALEGVVEGDGERSFELETADGGRARVRVLREHVGDAARTRIDIERSNAGRVEHERAEDVIGGGAPKRLSASVVAHERPFYERDEPASERVALFAPSDGAGGARLLMHRPGIDPEHVVELARLPFEVLVDGVDVAITEHEGGALTLAFTYGAGLVFELALAGPRAAPPPTTSLQTSDGAVRVEVENLPLEDDRQDEER